MKSFVNQKQLLLLKMFTKSAIVIKSLLKLTTFIVKFLMFTKLTTVTAIKLFTRTNYSFQSFELY